MRIAIHSYLQASHRLETEPGLWDVILVLDTGLRAAGRFHDLAKRSILLHFDDILQQEPDKRLATTPDIRRALTFAESSPNLMVTCRAGQSRSAALAFAIAHRNLGPAAALGLLDPRRHVIGGTGGPRAYQCDVVARG